MRLLKLMPDHPKFNFIGYRLAFFSVSVFLVLASFVLVFSKGLNFGIDFTGGIMIEVKMPEPGQIGVMRDKLAGLDLGSYELQEFGAPDDILIRIQPQDGGEAAQVAAVESVKAALGEGVEYRRTELVGPKVSGDLLMDGIYATVAAMLSIMVYVWFRFEWQFGVAGLVALSHDVIATIGVFSLIQHEFNLTTVAALLTIAGYSINDTVVVFDRVRENLRKYKTMPLPDLFNLSVNETLSRTSMTALTTLLALAALYIFGGEIIRDFAFAMIWGLFVGTYSSVCVATPMLLYMSIRRNAQAEDGETVEKTS